MTYPRPLTRAELAKFLPDQRAIRAFEKLFDLTPSDLEELSRLVEESNTSAIAAISKAAVALALLKQHTSDAAFENFAPVTEIVRHPSFDYIDLRKFSPHAAKIGRMAWNDDEDTISIHHSGGVVQQVGEEVYARISTNNLGVTINNGEVICLAGIGTGIAKYIADGTYPPQFVIGVATETIASGAAGRITTWGRVRGINTSTWSVGDVLWGSPSTAGAMTNVKPTAPDQSIPLAVVLVSDITEGVIFVRPVISEQLLFGAFYKSADATPAAANTAYTITFDGTVISSGISIDGTFASRIVAAESGLYAFNASFQISSSSSSSKNVWLWFRKNGTNVPNSTMKVSIDSATSIKSPSRSLFFSLNTNEYIELCWASDSTNVVLDASAATAFAPSSPAVVLTVNQIQQ